MKILLISNLFPPDVIGGYELGAAQVAGALRALGHEVLVLTSAPRTPVPPSDHVWRSLYLANIFSVNYTQQGSAATVLVENKANLVNAFNVYQLSEAVRRFCPDVAYVWHIGGLGGLALLACLRHLSVPWVWHLMDDVPAQLCKTLNGPIPSAAEFLKGIPGHFIACSRLLLQEIADQNVDLNGPIVVLPNWVEGLPPENAALRRPAKTLRIVSAGQVLRCKGIDLLIEAAGQIRDRGYRDFLVDVYGTISDASLLGLIGSLGLAEHVRLLGPLSQADLRDKYRRGDYDVFAFPTWNREPFGFAPLEAAAYGCVPIATDICGFSEWFVHNVHCLKIERSSCSLALALIEIMKGNVDVQAIGGRVSSAIWRDFSLPVIVKRIEAILKTAASQPRQSRGKPEEAYHIALIAEELTAEALLGAA